MFLALAVVTVAAATFAAPTTWIVDVKGGGNFTDIPPAIAAASDGDIILVRPGAYSGFTLNKKVTVKAETTVVQVNSSIVVDSIPAGAGSAVVSGFEVTAGSWPLLAVKSSNGDVVIDDVYLDDVSWQGTGSLIEIASSASVSLYDCVTPPYLYISLSGWGPLVSVDHSTVRACHVSWTGGKAVLWSIPGEIALYAVASTIVLEEPTITGGAGADSGGWMGHFYGEPGSGGTAIVASDSSLWLVGDGAAAIRGGDAGMYIDYYSYQQWYGKPGGAGLGLTRSSCIVSRCVVAGGRGYPDGPEYSGDPYSRDDSYAFLSLDPELHVGQASTLTLDAAPVAGTAILLLSDQGGAGEAGYKWLGPPLAVLDSAIYFVDDLGGLDGNGDWSITVDVPNDPSAAGMTWHLQAAVFEQSGALYLTNPVARTVGL